MSSAKNTSRTFNANALRTTATGARQNADDQHAAKRAENEARLSGLMALLVARTMDNLPSQEDLAKFAEEGKSGTVIAIAKPPSKRTEILPDGQEVQMFAHPAHETHFAGYKPGEETDHSAGGVPLISFFQGFLKKGGAGKPRPCPSTLPGGKNLGMVLQDRLLADAGGDVASALVTRTIWNGKRKQCEVHLVWDERGWDKWQRGIAERRQKFQAERRAHYEAQGGAPAPQREMMTLDQYMVKKQSQGDRRRAAREARDQSGAAEKPPTDDGWEQPRDRRRANRK